MEHLKQSQTIIDRHLPKTDPNYVDVIKEFGQRTKVYKSRDREYLKQ